MAEWTCLSFRTAAPSRAVSSATGSSTASSRPAPDSPSTPRQSSPDAALTYQENFPDQVCDPNAGAPHTVDQWFNTECFVRLTLPDRAGDVGNSPRNSVRGPNRVNVDMSLFKNIPFGGSKLVQLRFEVFNVLNRANFRLPQIRVNSSAFGVISSADDGRILQLGAKVIF